MIAHSTSLNNYHVQLPCATTSDFNFNFHAEVKLTYIVSDPALIVRRGRTDAGQFLKDLAIDAMRRVSRGYKYNQTGEAENEIARRIEGDIRDNGFKLTRQALVKLSLDESGEAFNSSKTDILTNAELSGLIQSTKLTLKQERAKIFAPLIKAGDWATLLAMLDLNDPEDAAIQAMVEATLNQQRMQAERQQKLLEIAIDKGAVEGWQLEGVAKALFKEVSGLSEQSIAFLEGKSQSQNLGDSQQTKDVKPHVPDEIKE